MQQRVCCSYAAPASLTGIKGFDCLAVPFAVTAGPNGVPLNSFLCGNNLGLPASTVCS